MKKDEIREYFRKLQKKSVKTQFGMMTKEEKSAYFRKLQKKAAISRRKKPVDNALTFHAPRANIEE